MAIRRPRKSVVALAGSQATEDAAWALAASLEEVGVETICLGREESAQRIAAAVADAKADAVELCLAGGGAVMVLRELLQELIRVGRRDASIVVHRIKSQRSRT
jgi:methylmalonyl-CoA mutase cobalamin-binding subunit